MPNTFDSVIKFEATTREIIDLAAFPSAPLTASIVRHTQFNKIVALPVGATVPITFASYFRITAGTSGTIDLTSLACVAGTLSAVGLRLQFIRLVNTGTGVFTLNEGAANGYSLGTNQKIVVPPGAMAQIYFPDVLGDVAAADRILDWANTIAGTVEITILCG